MNIYKANTIIEYFSLALILTYFFVHNINLVIIGIVFSLYLINFKYINIYMRSIKKLLTIEKADIKLNKEIKVDSNLMRSNEEISKLTLVESIEELGFIPSLDKNNDSNA